jgi:hypothetical protein
MPANLGTLRERLEEQRQADYTALLSHERRSAVDAGLHARLGREAARARLGRAAPFERSSASGPPVRECKREDFVPVSIPLAFPRDRELALQAGLRPLLAGLENR